MSNRINQTHICKWILKNDYALRKLSLIVVCFMIDRSSLYLARHIICFDINLAKGCRGKATGRGVRPRSGLWLCHLLAVRLGQVTQASELIYLIVK